MKRVLIIGIVIILAGLVGKVWYSNALGPAGGETTAFDVSQNEPVSAIAKDLKSKKLIRSPFAFGLHVRFAGLAPKFKAGRYLVSGKERATTIATKLTNPNESSNQFTIREGLTQREIAAELGKLGVTDEQEFADLKAKDFPQYDFLKGLPANASLEGFLFPDTYSIPAAGTSAHDVATVMLNQFDKELTPALRAKIKQSGHSLYETVIIASIVEEEVKTDADRQIVAGIMYKRLSEGIRLDIDATTRYAVGKAPRQPLTAADLASNDPYNTRKVKGLPPGPIANPGLSSLEAAISPKTTDYLFYLTGSDGTTHYAKTNDEHEQNKRKYL